MKTLESVTINALELASELAHLKLISNHSETMDIMEVSEDGTENYTEEAQDLFNDYYDEYLSLIESCSTNNNN